MSFSYNLSTPNDITRVRYHLADTDADNVLFSDEEITFFVSENSTWQRAVIACLENLKARLATTPEFTADWLTIRNGASISALESLITSKRRELGVPMLTGTVSYQYRPDSDQTEEPDYD